MRTLALLTAAVASAAAAASGSSGAAPASQIVFAANRSSTWWGEIYRVDADGRRLDLTRSPAPDLAPALSPDGKRLAFLSGRRGRWAVYVVGVDGRGLRRISPVLFPLLPNDGVVATIAWAPDGRHLAAAIAGASAKPALYLGDTGGGWRAYAQDVNAGEAAPAWSPDGRLLAYTTNDGLVRVTSATGRSLWAVGGAGAASWSADDRLAVSADSETIHVYDRRGREVAAFSGEAFAWSPGGKLLASTHGSRLEVRRGGSGRPIVDVKMGRPGGVAPQWAGRTRLRVFGPDGWTGYDLARRAPWRLDGPATAFDSVVSASGDVVAEAGGGSTPVTLTLSRGDSAPKTLATAPWCPDDESFAGLAFVPHRRSVVYQTACPDPPADLWSVAPDGSGLRRLADTTTDERQPSLSPDGSTVVYVQRETASKCEGCPQTLWRVPVGGGVPQQLTSHTYDEDAPFDDAPGWSPDGSSIVFTRSGADSPFELLTIPAGGGAARALGVRGVRLPAWGPERLAFVGYARGRTLLQTADPAGGPVSTVASLRGSDIGAVAWSRDGRLAYLALDAEGLASIATVGSTAQPIRLAGLLPHGSSVQGLAWSPDAGRFAFVATDANGVGEVYTIRADGTGLTRVTKAVGAVGGGLSWG